MYAKTLPKNGEKILELLVEDNLLSGFYLVGGTGVALQLGHRKSDDFDFFSPKNFNTKKMISRLNNLGNFKLLDEAKGTVTGIFNNVKLSFFCYQYPLLWDLNDFKGIKVADPREIGLMKFTAIAGRGSKKDFIDLYWIGNEIIPLSELFAFFNKKYGSGYSLYHILKSLVYFEDAEKDKEPIMLKAINWEQIKEYFLKEQKKLFNMFYE